MRDALLDVSPEGLAAVAMRQLHSGAVVDGRFVIRDLIGQGGMGLALRAWDSEWERDCVLKILAPHMHRSFRPDPDCAEMLRREAKTLVRLASQDSSAFVQVYGRGDVPLVLDESGGRRTIELPYYAMELLRGSTFQRIIRQKRRGQSEAFGGWYMILTLAQKMATALAVAHSLGIVHRDLKPDNIYLHQLLHRWEVKIIDWGISTIEGQPRRVGTGTDRYAAPELVQRVAPQNDQESTKSDIYPLGLVMYELATGRGPFEVGKGQFARAHASQKPPLLSEFRRDAPPGFVTIVDAMLAKDPSRRPAAAEVLAVLEDMLRETPNEVLDTQIQELLPAHRASTAASRPLPMVASAPLRTDQAMSSLRSETFPPAVGAPASARAAVTVPLAPRSAPAVPKYADTEPDREPFGALAESTAPLGAPLAEPAHVRVLQSTAEMFELWEDDTRYASSPLADHPSPPQAEEPRLVEIGPLDVTSSEPVVRVVPTTRTVGSPARRFAIAAITASLGLLLAGVAIRVNRNLHSSNGAPAQTAAAVSDSPAPVVSVWAAVALTPSPVGSAELPVAGDGLDASDVRTHEVVRAPADGRTAISRPRAPLKTRAEIDQASTKAPDASPLDDLNRDITH